MLRFLPILVGISAVLATGFVHGVWTDRWKLSNEPERSAERMSHIPTSLEDWEGEAVRANFKQDAGIAGDIYYRYTHRRTGKTVTLYMVCGRPGPVSIHTPDVCYGASGYDMVSQSQFTAPAGSTEVPAEFWTAQFRKTQATDQTILRIFWSWNAGDKWQAPENPRFEFARYPALYKLYLIHEMAADEPLNEDPCVDLMKQLLPAVQHAFASPS